MAGLERVDLPIGFWSTNSTADMRLRSPCSERNMPGASPGSPRCRAWGGGCSWENQDAGGPHEANFLKLDCSKLKSVFGWKPRYHVQEAVEKTVEWAKSYLAGEDVREVMDRQIMEFFSR